MKKNNILVPVSLLVGALIVSGCAPMPDKRHAQSGNRSATNKYCSNTGSLKDGSCELLGFSERKVRRDAHANDYRYDGSPSPREKQEALAAKPKVEAVVRKAPSPPEIVKRTEFDNIWQRVSQDVEFLPLAQRAEVEEMEAWYTKHPYYLGKVSKRASRYLHYILHQLEQRGMPTDLALLPIVESAYDPLAYSHGRASGLWQFVPNTAKHMGLEQNWWYDGRRDVIAATDAALDYLTELNERFDGDWLLTLAAYNAGAGTVNKAIRKNAAKDKPTDFWSLPLPKETRGYIPKLLALVKIYKNPAGYNVNLPPVPDKPHFAIIATGGQLDLAQAAKLADITTEELYRLNPGFNRWMTAPEGPHRLLVPFQNANAFRQRLASLEPNKRIAWQKYQVQPGDSLIKIARAHHIDVASIKAHNHIQGSMLKAGQVLLIPDARESGAGAQQGDELIKQHYVVLAGDTLSGIATKHNVSTRELAQWNKLSSKSVIKPGQKLELWLERSSDERLVKKVGYKVRKGDSLSLIASRFQVKIRDIVQWNEINPGHYLRPGQSLTLYVDITRAGL